KGAARQKAPNSPTVAARGETKPPQMLLGRRCGLERELKQAQIKHAFAAALVGAVLVASVLVIVPTDSVKLSCTPNCNRNRSTVCAVFVAEPLTHKHTQRR